MLHIQGFWIHRSTMILSFPNFYYSASTGAIGSLWQQNPPIICYSPAPTTIASYFDLRELTVDLKFFLVRDCTTSRPTWIWPMMASVYRLTLQCQALKSFNCSISSMVMMYYHKIGNMYHIHIWPCFCSCYWLPLATLKWIGVWAQPTQTKL